jgi:ATP-dependent DNA helicase RecG
MANNLIDLIAQGENKTLEFKETLPKNESIAKTVVAFSNTSGGRLIIGVNDNRKIIGIADENLSELQDTIVSVIMDRCHPNILPEIYTLNIEGKLLLVIEIFKGSLLPYYLKSEGKAEGTYIRIGATNRKASIENIMELERQKRHIGFDEEINTEVDFISLDLTPLLNRFATSEKSLDQQKLSNLKLIKTENGKTYPTNALLILLGYFSHCTVKCARFKGVTMELFIDKKEYSGDIFEILENTQNFILNHINLRGEIKGLYRTDTYEIPLVALREALINALIHRDYTNGGRDIKVGVYDDIVNIVSPGSFPNSITAEDIAQGRSEARNKTVANIFKELGLIEQWGSGIARIKILCAENGLRETLIEEKNDYVDVEFYRPVVDATVQITGVQVKATIEDVITSANDQSRPITTDYDQLRPEEITVIKYLQSNASITRKDAKEILSIGETKIKELFNVLIEKGLIQRYGNGRSTYYKGIF